MVAEMAMNFSSDLEMSVDGLPVLQFEISYISVSVAGLPVPMLSDNFFLY